MDFTNINDPAGINALLDQLRASQAWQEVNTDVNASRPDGNPPGRDSISGPSPHVPEPVESSPSVSNHISSLLSRLQPGVGASPSPLPGTLPKAHSYHEPIEEFSLRSSPLKVYDSRYSPEIKPTTRPSAPQPKSLKALPFIQALPVIARLAEDPAFVKKLDKMREDQEHLEQQLWHDRTKILKTQEEKVKVAQAKAAMVGTGLDHRNNSALEIAFSKELKAFDSDQALLAWDALVARQQSALEALGVPGMFVTALKSDREKQARIIQVLDGLSGPEDEDQSMAL